MIFGFSQTVLIQTILFSISRQFSPIYPIERVLSSATTPGQSGPGSNGNEGMLHISQSPSITETSPSDCLVPYLLWCSRCILLSQPTGQPVTL